MLSFLESRLSPFRNVQFTVFFIVRTLSLIGRWSHDLARAWLILELTGTSSWQGAVMLASALPMSFLILRGGALVDRSDAKKIMIWTQLFLGLLVLALALFCEWGKIQVWHFMVFAFIEGIIISFDSPTFLAVVVRIVERKDFQQAMALNSMNFHVGRMLGPLLAGAVLTVWGPSLVFFIDALGFFSVTVALLFLKVKPPIYKATKEQRWSDFKYFFSDPKQRYQLGQLFLSMATIFPIFIVVLRTFAAKQFGLEAADFGRLFMFPALGAVLGSLLFALWKPKNPISTVKLGVPMIFIFYQAVVFAPNMYVAGPIMCLMGLSGYLMFAALTVGLQLDVEEEFRGRVSALIGLSFGAIGPFFSYPVGFFADLFGEVFTIRFITALFVVFSFIWYNFNKDVFKSSSLDFR